MKHSNGHLFILFPSPVLTSRLANCVRGQCREDDFRDGLQADRPIFSGSLTLRHLSPMTCTGKKTADI